MRMWKNSRSCALLIGGCKLAHPLQPIICSFLQNLKAELTFGPIILPQVHAPYN